jgi:hypothetical protein
MKPKPHIYWRNGRWVMVKGDDPLQNFWTSKWIGRWLLLNGKAFGQGK